MDSKETAKYIGVSIGTLRNYVHNEGLPVLRFPGKRKWVFRKDLVDDWMIKRSTPVIMNDPSEDKEQKKDYGRLRILSPHSKQSII